MYKIAVIGDYDSIYGFAALGLDIFPAVDRKEIEQNSQLWLSMDMELSILQKRSSRVWTADRKTSGRNLPAIIQIPGVRQHRKWSTGCEKLCGAGSRF